MSLGDWLQSMRMWKFETLGDFARVTRWLDVCRKKDKTVKAMSTYFRNMHSVLRDCTTQYEEKVIALDAATKPVLTSMDMPALSGMQLSTGENLISSFHKKAAEMREWFDGLWKKPADEFLNTWSETVDDSEKYFNLMNRLVRDFANFEVLIICLPGTGSAITNKPVQQCLEDMFWLNMRMIRMLDLIRTVRQSWRSNRRSWGFLNPTTDLRDMIVTLFQEYIEEADPIRIAAKQAKALSTGRSYSKYRFWRAAESFRQMAGVDYGSGQDRTPRMTRNYIKTDLQSVPAVVTDFQRLDWAIKEIVNNALAATCVIRFEQQGLMAEPLARHMGASSASAVKISLVAREGAGDKKTLRLTVTDGGHGIPRDHLYSTYLWGYSPRRAELQAQFLESHAKKSVKKNAVLIGGKGIGMPFARAVFREHGGDLTIADSSDVGTTIIMDIPAPSAVPQLKLIS